jgi:hypothetical protein
MLLSDPKWGKGCLTVLAFVAIWTLIRTSMIHFEWSIPKPIGSLIGFLIFLGIARLIVNQIFD